MVTRIALIGLPGAGKSTVATLLALRLGCASVDLDVEIERPAGTTIAAIFEREGEERFRELESRALARELKKRGPLVLACGGGILGRRENRELLRSHARVVWLGVDPGSAARRLLASGSAGRPLLAGNQGGTLEERLAELLASRAADYAAAAEATVDTAGLGPEEVASRIAARLALA